MNIVYFVKKKKKNQNIFTIFSSLASDPVTLVNIFYILDSLFLWLKYVQ
jgi:hypothetical protein